MTASPENPEELFDSTYRAPAAALVTARTCPHSGRGIASLVIAIFLLVILGGWMAYLLITLSATGLDINSRSPLYFGIAVLVSMFGFAFGMLLAVSGLMQAERKRPFAWVAVVVNGLSLLALAALFAYAIHSALRAVPPVSA